MDLDRKYLEELKKRAKTSRAYQKHQLTGLELADVLGDWEHRALYIKLAKEKNNLLLWRLAKETADSRNVKNMGAYFMRLLEIAEKGKQNENTKRSK